MKNTLLLSALVIVSASLFFLAASGPEETDISGDWEMSFESPRGSMTRPVSFRQNGAELLITMTTREGETIEHKGSITENEITWKARQPMRRRDGEIEVIYKGTVEGDSITGTMDLGGYRTIEWTAKRKPKE